MDNLNLYSVIYDLLNNALFGGAVVSTTLQGVSVSLLSTFFTLLLVAVPFILFTFIVKWVVCLWK